MFHEDAICAGSCFEAGLKVGPCSEFDGREISEHDLCGCRCALRCVDRHRVGLGGGGRGSESRAPG